MKFRLPLPLPPSFMKFNKDFQHPRLLCAICYHLYNLKNVKNTHEGVFLLVSLEVSVCNFQFVKKFDRIHKKLHRSQMIFPKFLSSPVNRLLLRNIFSIRIDIGKICFQNSLPVPREPFMSFIDDAEDTWQPVTVNIFVFFRKEQSVVIFIKNKV